MGRKQFTFYESFFRAVSRIKKKADRATAYDAICAYALCGQEPNLDELPDAAAIAFDLIKPNLDSSKRKAESGKTGGQSKHGESKPEASAKRTGSKSKANKKQTAREKEGEKEVEGEVEIEKEVEDDSPPPKPPLDLSTVSDGVRPAVSEWLSYKKERRESYKPQGLSQFLSMVAKNAAQYGCEAVSAIIRQSMASGYQGVTWDRLSRQSGLSPRQQQQAGGGFNPFLDMLREEEKA